MEAGLGLFGLVLAVLFAVFAAVLSIVEPLVLYHPPPKYDGPVTGASELRFDTSQGAQHSYLVASKQTGPKELWVLFHGNAARAADWLSLLQAERYPQCDFLLVEYPGYAGNEGSPNPDAMREQVDAALSALSLHHKQSLKKAYGCFNLLGYSLGTAVALHWAAELSSFKAFKAELPMLVTIGLIAPFTSTAAFLPSALQTVLKPFLQHPYDNLSAMERIAPHNGLTAFLIVRGAKDTLMPPTMSQELTAAAGDAGFFPILEEVAGNHISMLRPAFDVVSRAFGKFASTPIGARL